MSMKFEFERLAEDIGRQGTRGTRVLDAIRQAIVQLRLRPGDLLSEAEVARLLGVSRQPVREAFIKLAELGLVEIRPQRGTFVVLISKREVQNARFIREAVEVAVVRKAAEEASDDAIAAIRRVLEQQRKANADADNVAFLALDDAFHRGLAQAVDCEDAWRVLESRKAQMDRVRYLSMPEATPLETLIAQHEAIARHDPEEAETAMRAHLSEITKSLPRLARNYPELFSD